MEESNRRVAKCQLVNILNTLLSSLSRTCLQSSQMRRNPLQLTLKRRQKNLKLNQSLRIIQKVKRRISSSSHLSSTKLLRTLPHPQRIIQYLLQKIILQAFKEIPSLLLRMWVEKRIRRKRRRKKRKRQRNLSQNRKLLRKTLHLGNKMRVNNRRVRSSNRSHSSYQFNALVQF